MNRLTGLAAFLVALILPSTATAAPLNELPFEPRSAVAGCVEPTGAPGGISALGAYSRTASSTDMRLVTGAGIDRSASVSVGRLLDCAAVAQAGQAAVVAGVAVSREGAAYRMELRAVVRDPGGDYGPPQPLSDAARDPAAAIAPDGQAVVAWADRAGRQTRIMAARRAPGAAFGAPEVISSWPAVTFDEVDVRTGIDAAGHVTVLWARERMTGQQVVEVATAAAGAAFAVQRLTGRGGFEAAPELAVAPDGWTLLTYEASDDVELPKVFERAPGAARFSAVTLPAEDRFGWSLGGTVVAIRDGGGAVVAWPTGPFESHSGVDAMTRETAGAFTARRVARPGSRTFFNSLAREDVGSLFDPFAAVPTGSERARLRAALGADGRIVLAWPAPAGGRPVVGLATRAAIGRLDGTFEPARTIGSPMRNVASIAPLFTTDGRAAVVWADNDSSRRHGRLHAAVEGAPEPAPVTAPRLTLRAKRFQRLFASQSVRLMARCSAACDVRATVRGPRGSDDDVAVTRLRGGAFALAPGAVDAIRPGRSRMVRVVVHATPPGGGETAVRSLLVRVARRPSLPVRSAVGLRVHRRGDAIVVRWRTRRPARRQFFIIAGHPRPEADATAGAVAYRDGGGRTRFRVVLRPAEPAQVRWVSVFSQGRDDFDDGRTAVVRVG